MVLFAVKKVPKTMRGDLSCWLIEISTGVFIGNISALVRELLWKRACDKMGDGGFVMVYSYPNEQGFILRWAGNISREFVEMEGLTMVRKPYNLLKKFLQKEKNDYT